MKNYYSNINYIGVTYKHSKVDIRESFSLSDKEIEYLYNKRHLFNIDELFIISTCARTEFYAFCDPNILFEFVDYIYKKLNKNIDKSEFRKMNGNTCVKHLMKVTSGIDSFVIGETQITSQIKNAFKISLNNSSTGQILSKLIQFSLEAGKRIKNETKLSDGSLSTSYAAVVKLKNSFGKLDKLNIFVIGAGVTGKTTTYSLIKNGAKNITIVNRNIKRGEDLAKSFKTQFIPLKNLSESFHKADVIITCTNSKELLLKQKDFKKIIQRKQLYLIDLSVPRNIDPNIKKMSNATLVTIDNLENIITKNKTARKAELPKANHIIDVISAEYSKWFKQLDVIPTIVGLKNFFENIQTNELIKLKNKYDNDTINAIDIFSKSLLKKLLKDPITSLKSEQSDDNSKLKIIEALKSIYPI